MILHMLRVRKLELRRKYAGTRRAILFYTLFT